MGQEQISRSAYNKIMTHWDSERVPRIPPEVGLHKEAPAEQSGECPQKGLVQSTTVRFVINEYLSVSEGLRTDMTLLLSFI